MFKLIEIRQFGPPNFPGLYRSRLYRKMGWVPPTQQLRPTKLGFAVLWIVLIFGMWFVASHQGMTRL